MVLFWARVQGIFVQQRVNTGPRNKQPSWNHHRSAAMPLMSVTCHHLWFPDCYPPFLEVTAGHSLQQQENKQHQSYHLPCFSELDALLDIMCEGILPKGTREGQERCRQRRVAMETLTSPLDLWPDVSHLHPDVATHSLFRQVANPTARDKGGLVPAPSVHMASILRTGQLLPLLLRSPGLFLMMVTSQMPDHKIPAVRHIPQSRCDFNCISP